MIIVAGTLQVDARQRDAYLAGVHEVARQARASDGCLDFVQVADPLEPDRIVIYERWATDEELMAFRTSGPVTDQSAVHLPDITGADVHKFRISSIEQP